MMKVVSSVFLIFILLFSSSYLLAQDKSGIILEKITVEKKDSKGEVIIFKLSGSVMPKMFTIKGKKPRIVFDFFYTSSSNLISHTINTKGHLIQHIRVGIHQKPKPKTRVVIDLVPGKQVEVTKKFNKEEKLLVVTVFQAGQQIETKKDKILPAEKAKKEVKQVVNRVIPPKVVEKKSEEDSKKIAIKESAESAEEKIASSPVKEKEEQKEEEKEEEKDTNAPFLSEVTFEDSSNKGEMVMFKLNDFYPPIVFGIEKGEPRVVCDFLGTDFSKDVKKTINSNGKFVKRIRLAKHKNPDKIRVVLDLVPNSNYDLQQVFFKEDNLFVIIINPLEAGDKLKPTN